LVAAIGAEVIDALARALPHSDGGDDVAGRGVNARPALFSEAEEGKLTGPVAPQA
jgi:hypothetical protein